MTLFQYVFHQTGVNELKEMLIFLWDLILLIYDRQKKVSRMYLKPIYMS